MGVKRLGFCALLWLCTLCGSLQAGVLTIRQASLQVHTAGHLVSIEAQSLPFRWDENFPGDNGWVRYSITLPPRYASPDAPPYAVYAPRAGNQVQVFLNGRMIDGTGVLNNPIQDSSKQPYWVTIPAALLLTDRPNLLVFNTTVQALRWGGCRRSFTDQRLSYTSNISFVYGGNMTRTS